jgi:hypothetical protein
MELPTSIKIEQRHIDKSNELRQKAKETGEFFSASCSCPLALAGQEQLKDKKMLAGFKTLVDADGITEYVLDDSAIKFTVDFDTGNPVQPTEIKIVKINRF